MHSPRLSRPIIRGKCSKNWTERSPVNKDCGLKLSLTQRVKARCAVKAREALLRNGEKRMSRTLNMAEALQEARRCLHCSIPGCRKGCPIANNIPDFIQALKEGNIGAAYEIIAKRSNLPAICGRVCPHEKQCEAHCVLARSKREIKIGDLEMFIADFAHKYGLKPIPKSNGARGKVAVIGSGPAGLTVAGDLAKMNFAVTVFEKQPEPGGILLFGIPEFRLSKSVVQQEIEQLRNIGVEFRCNVLAGPDYTVDDMFAEGFDAIFMGTGTAFPRTLDIPGKGLAGIVTAAYYLRMAYLVKAGQLDDKELLLHEGDRVAVIGAGNVAMDAARTAVRRGAGEVTVFYRKTEQEVPAFPSEIEAAKAEHVQFRFLREPLRFLSKKEMAEKTGAHLSVDESTANVKVQEALEKNLLGAEEEETTLVAGADQTVGGMAFRVLEKGEDGNFVATEKEEYHAFDSVILAVGSKPAARIVGTTKGIKVDNRGFVITRERPYGMTTRMGVFSGGDVVHGPATVVLAMKESKRVAIGIAEYVDAKNLLQDCRE